MATRAHPTTTGAFGAPPTRAFTIWAILFIILGALAIALPFGAGLGVTIFLGWIIVFTGFAHIASAFSHRGVAGNIWRVLLGLLYIGGGLFIAFQPGIGLLSLTLVIASLFLAEGILLTIAFFRIRSMPGSGWLLADGIVTLLLGLLIWIRWPASAVWAVGTLLGINLIMSGVALLMFSATVRKVLAVPVPA
jgi:uncharacterized membrane protein HdeD (DUF308 family)